MDTVLQKGNWLIFSLILLLVSGLGDIASAQVHKDLLHEQRYQQDLLYRRGWDRLQSYLYQQVPQGLSTQNTRAEVLTIPVVVHVMHQPGDVLPKEGTSNITDDQVRLGIQRLNDAFRNRGAFEGGPFYTSAADSAPSVDTYIEFVLAKSDTNGLPTNGITRFPSNLSNVTLTGDSHSGAYPNQEIELKSQSIWDPKYYLNIWIVDELCLEEGNCKALGYAWSDGAHGSIQDGIVIEAAFWGSKDESDAAVAAHYAGRYLSLVPTYNVASNDNWSCENGDCYANGDFICDTPPDTTVGGPGCGNYQNSCSSDTLPFLSNPSDPNSVRPSYFPQDVEDMYENFMDGDAPTCKRVFTQGQMVRMRSTLNRQSVNGAPTRNWLLNSPGLLERPFDVALQPNTSLDLRCNGRNVFPSFKIKNLGTQPLTNLTFEARLSNGTSISEEWEGYLEPGGTLPFEMRQSLRVYGTFGLLEVRAAYIQGNDKDADLKNHQFRLPIIIPQNSFPASPNLYCRDFEDGNAPGDWDIKQTDTTEGFGLVATEDCNANAGFMMRHKRRTHVISNDPLPNRDFLIGPTFNLEDYGLVVLKFNVAYHPQEMRYDPTLRIYASVCGQEPMLVYEKTGLEITKSDSLLDASFREDWMPTCADWRSESIDLSNLSGQQVRLIVEVATDSTSTPNLYLDNLCIEAEIACEPPRYIPAQPGSVQADYTCYGRGGWIHYIKAADEQFPQEQLLFSLRNDPINPVQIAPEDVTMTITDQYGAGGHEMTDSAGYAENTLGWYTTARYLTFANPPTLQEPIVVRTYFDQQDVADMWQVVPEMAGTGKLVFFTLGGDMPVDPWQKHRGISPVDYREFLPGDSMTQHLWALNSTDNYYGATMMVDELRYIGAGTGGDGIGMGARYPVGFEPFGVQQVRSQVELSGTLARERGTVQIEVHRATETSPRTLIPGEFEVIHTFEPQGFSDQPFTYDFVETKPLQETVFYFYRVRHENGFSYDSDTVRFAFDLAKLVNFYPNPTDGTAYIKIDARADVPVKLNVLDANRRTLLTFDWTHGLQPQKVDISSLPGGIYFYQVIYQEQSYWGKIVKIE